MRNHVEINKKYGSLTVVEKMPYENDEKGRKILKFKCICDCGNEVIVRSNNLLSGNTRSCGCQSSRYNHHNKLYLVGQKYGRLTVLSEDNDGKWNCVCDCGNYCTVSRGALRSGNTQSCGCFQKERAVESNLIDLTGSKFGILTVLNRIENKEDRRNERQTYYNCLCECGNETVVNAYELKTGHTKSCGCLKSVGERQTEEILKRMNIEYEKQYSFPDLLGPNGGLLMFDFCIKDNDNIHLIEYQGIQHYKNTEFGYMQREITDKTKREYCKTHGINLFEIKYDENVEDSLHNIITTIHANTVPSQ